MSTDLDRLVVALARQMRDSAVPANEITSTVNELRRLADLGLREVTLHAGGKAWRIPLPASIARSATLTRPISRK